MNSITSNYSKTHYKQTKATESFCKKFFHVIRTAINFLICSQKSAQKKIIKHKGVKQPKTVSTAIRKDGYTKGMTHQKVDYLVKLLLPKKETLEWMQFDDLSQSNIDQKAIIMQTLEITSVEALKNFQKNIPICIKQFIKEDNLPSKIFIPFAYKFPVPHSMLIVVEPEDSETARITLIDSLGDSPSYRKTLMGFAKELQKAFSSPNTNVVRNTVSQQSDGTSCGFQVIENILLLAEQENVQQFVQNGNLPPRSPKKVKQIYKHYIQQLNQPNLSKV